MPVDAKTKYKAKKTKIVFFDIDDTLRVKKTGYIPESIKAVFKGLKEKGILTGIATGRGYYGVVEDIRDLEPDYFVTINGTYVINRKGEEIYNQPLAREVTEAFVAWCKEIGIAWGFAGKDKPVVSERSDLIDDANSSMEQDAESLIEAIIEAIFSGNKKNKKKGLQLVR